MRRAAIGFLDGLAIVYSSILVAALVSVCVLTLRRSRGSLSPALARMVLLSTSVILSLVAAEAGTEFCRAWLHRVPRLPSAQSVEGTLGTGPDSSREPTTGEAPDTRSRQAHGKSRIKGGILPLRILVIGESSGRGEPYNPWLSVGQIVAWRLKNVFPERPTQNSRQSLDSSSQCPLNEWRMIFWCLSDAAYFLLPTFFLFRICLCGSGGDS
jgi:hypothetical protein